MFFKSQAIGLLITAHTQYPSPNSRQKQSGFTLIELVMVIIILGIIAVIAVPRFVNLSTDARSRVVGQIEVASNAANHFIQLKALMPSYTARPVAGRSDLTDIDLNGDGNFDLRLKCDYLDNTDVEKQIIFPSEMSLAYQGITDTYIGYDFNQNGSPIDDQCYFRYVQAEAPGNICNGVPPQYQTNYNGC